MLARGTLHVQTTVDYPRAVYTDRIGAGDALVAWIRPVEDPDALVFALPRGGIPVAQPFASAIGCDMRPILVRKLPVPWSPEMGFGAITVDGTITLNEPIVRELGIDAATVDRVAARTLAEVERRRDAYPGGWPLPPLEGRHVWLVDDGLATGFSAVAAARMIRAHRCARLSIAVPCGPLDTAQMLTAEADDVWCAVAQQYGAFAVAAFYRDFHDMSDAEVVELLGWSPS